ncbi:MAG: LamG domain-containing protein, partial [Candidatus Paceibacterota bacterium]
NTTSTGNYYTYITGGSWELTSSMESAKYKLGGANDKTSKDGGSYTGLYELGTNLTLLPLDYGDTSLVGYWKFDEGTGTTAYDASGHNKNGTLVNGPTWSTGKQGGAINFTLTEDYVSTPNINIDDKLSIALWAKATDGASGRLIDKAWPENGSFLFYRASSNLDFGMKNVAGTRIDAMSNSNSFPAGQWIFIVGTWDNSSANIFINAVKQEQSVNFNGSINRTDNLFIGGGSAATSFNGLIDDIRIYNRALSAAEIFALYSATNK